MPSKPKSQTEHVALKPLYLIGELARLAHVSRHLMSQLLQSSRVTYVRIGRMWFVPLSEIQEKLPSLWKSMCFALKARATAERDPRTVEGSPPLASSDNPLSLRGSRS
jgi:hypothetical protein